MPHPPQFRFAHIIGKFIAKLLTAKAFILEQFRQARTGDVEKTCAGYRMERRTESGRRICDACEFLKYNGRILTGPRGTNTEVEDEGGAGLEVLNCYFVSEEP